MNGFNKLVVKKKHLTGQHKTNITHLAAVDDHVFRTCEEFELIQLQFLSGYWNHFLDPFNTPGKLLVLDHKLTQSKDMSKSTTAQPTHNTQLTAVTDAKPISLLMILSINSSVASIEIPVNILSRPDEGNFFGFFTNFLTGLFLTAVFMLRGSLPVFLPFLP
jgi:hypothetical protein